MPDPKQTVGSDIQPVRLSELPNLVEEFFARGYREHRFGLGGTWMGSDLSWLRLDRSVDRETFGKVFSFRSPAGDQLPPPEWSETDPIVAQRINFTGNPLVSRLWGLSSPARRLSLVGMRSLATEQAVKFLQKVALLESESDLPILGRGCHCAVFHSGAAPDQTPRLETTVLFAQQYRLPSGKEVHFPLVLAPGAVSELIGRWEWRRLSENLGTFGLTERTQIPENLFSTPTLRDLGRTDEPHLNRRLGGSELFAAWRNQAAIKGFDEDRVEAMFQAGRLLGKVVRWDRNGLDPEGLKAVYHAVARTGSQLSTPTMEKDRSHGPSL